MYKNDIFSLNQKSNFSQKLTVLEQNGQRRKKDNSKVDLKANEKGSSTKPLLNETHEYSRSWKK